MEASIIIRTFNEARYLERLLKGIQAQNYSDWEIIVVDSGSTDETVEIARRYTPNVYNIPQEAFTFGRSLNIGCQRAQGKYLVVVSAHTYPANNSWLRNLLRPFQDLLVGMVYGCQRGDHRTRVGEERDLARVFGTTSHILVDEPTGNNANAAIRRDLWLEIPYDETLPGLEDAEWARRAQKQGYRVYYTADAVIRHIHQESVLQIYRRHKREAVALKRLFPGWRFRLRNLMKNTLVETLRDMLYAIRVRKSLTQALGAPLWRGAQFLAVYHGANSHKALGRLALRGLSYPKLCTSVLIAGPGQHSLVTREPPPLGEEEVAIQVAYAGVCSTDLEVLSGGLEYYQRQHARYPIVPGHEYSGLVVAVGKNTRGLVKGDKVVGENVIGCGACQPCRKGEPYRCATRREMGVINMDGAYSTLVRLPASLVHRLPPEVPLRYAALVEPLAVCLKGLGKLAPQPGRPAGVVGAGPIGNLCAQLLLRRGLSVTVFDPNEARLRIVARYGADTFTDLGDLERYDYLIEASGDQEALGPLLEQSKPAAKVLLLGLPYTQATPVAFATVVCYDKEVYGSIASAREHWTEAIRLVHTDALNLDDLTDTIYPLAQYQKAWEAHRRRDHLKVLLSVSDELLSL